VLNDGQDSEEEGDRRGAMGIDVPEPERVENADKERANAGVDSQQLAEMQKEMLEEVGTYPGITKIILRASVCVCVCVCVCASARAPWCLCMTLCVRVCVYVYVWLGGALSTAFPALCHGRRQTQ
jgi:hypothetical protein